MPGAAMPPCLAFALGSAFVSRAASPPACRGCPAAPPRRRAFVVMGLKGRIADMVAGRVLQALAERRAAAKVAAAGAAADEPPPGLLLDGLLGEVQKLAAGDVSGALGGFVAAAKGKVGSAAFGGGAAELVKGKLGAVAALSADDAVRALATLRDMATGGGGEAVGAAVAGAMRAIGVGADDDDDDLERSVDTPTAPAFDPVTALILAGYGFQAYLSPARGAYWETFSAAVPGSQVSERARQTITTRVAYPSTDAIARTACGVFMVHVEAVRAAGGARPLPDKFYVVAVLNRALHEDALKGGRADFSLLQRAGAGCGADDALVLAVYESRAAYASGGSVLGEARVPLGELVAAARGQPGGARGEPALALFEPVSEDRASEDFFEADLLPEGMSLPFRLPTMKGKDARERFARDVHGTAAEIQIAYVPFDAPAGCEGEEDEDEDEGEGGEGGAEVSEAEVTAISESMKDGEMPLDWQRLAKELHATVSSLRDSSLRPAAGYIREDMPKAMFIASPDTDSEVWLWHDKVNKNVVVSYRGTEQTKWKDFVTDSLVFLQAWSPGAPVTLDIAPGRTMGLDMWDVVLYGSKKGLEDDVSAMSCCHWGFLRAYLSLRDSVDHALAQFTDNFSDGYSYYFTGHSLGGALATLSAADTQARHGGPGASLDVTMINYGSPRVGNRAFCREYNRLVPNSFRVVNGSDLVARMPQTPSRLRGGFRHVGRTCLVDETGSVWVQGADGDVSSTFPPPDMDRLSGLLAREREMWQLLISGKSLGHHMEDSYFLSLKGVVEQLFA